MNLPTVPAKLHLLGIKGQAMTALAEILQGLGYIVTGSDVADEFTTDVVLKRLGIPVQAGFSPEHIAPDVAGVIYSTAFGEDNPEWQESQRRQVPLWSCPQVVGYLITLFPNSVAVAGSHGKTTTTSMLALMLEDGGLTPTAMVGSPVGRWGSSARFHHSDWFVLEADEYQNKLALYHPRFAVITNVDYDHPDFFATKTDYEKVFVDFVNKLPLNGLLVLDDGDYFTPTLKMVAKGKVETFGFGAGATWRITDLRIDYRGTYFSLNHGEDFFTDLFIPVAGKQYALDATAAIIMATTIGVTMDVIYKTLKQYANTKRRMEVWGTFQGATVIDDFAHHPTEISVTLQAIRAAYPQSRVWCVFEAHTYSRTQALLPEFGEALSLADYVLLYPIFGSAREHVVSISNTDLAAAVNAVKPNTATPVNDIYSAKSQLAAVLASDVIVTMGAGDVWQLAELLTKRKI